MSHHLCKRIAPTLKLRHIAVACLFTLVVSGTLRAQETMFIDSTGNVGIGTETPSRQLHVVGDDAVFRMDRPVNSPAFLLVRTDVSGAPLQTFVVGTRVDGGNGQFFIDDLGAAVEGDGARRMTIHGSGNVTFTGSVTAQSISESSSRDLKTDIETISDARDSLTELRGVRFTWKESGKASVGFVAEEVAKVLPQLVDRDAEDGKPVAVNYSALTAILVEAYKEQAREIQAQNAAIQESLMTLAEQRNKIARLEARLSETENIETRINRLEKLVLHGGSQLTAVRD